MDSSGLGSTAALPHSRSVGAVGFPERSQVPSSQSQGPSATPALEGGFEAVCTERRGSVRELGTPISRSDIV